MSSFDDWVKAYEIQVRDWLAKCPICTLRPEVVLHARRGSAMIQVGQSFEFDHRLKAYEEPPNHVFASRLVPINGKVKHPIVFWVSSGFPASCEYQRHKEPVIHHVLRFGGRYSFQSVYDALKQALKEEGIDIDTLGDWEVE